MAAASWITEHPIHASISTLQEAVRAAQERMDKDEITDAGEDLSRVRQTATYLSQSLKRVDPLFTSRQTVKSLQAPVDEATSELNQFAGNGNQGHLTNANNKIDVVLRTMAEIRPAPSDDASAYLAAFDALNDRINELGALATTRLSELEDVRSKMSEELASLGTGIEAANERVGQAVADLEEKKTEAMSEVDARAKEFQGQLDAKLSAFDANAEERVQAKESAFDEGLKDQQGTASTALERLKELQNDATEIVGVIGRTGMTGGYQQDATEQREAADKWRRYTVVFGLAAVTVLVWSVLLAPVSVTTQQLINRVLLSAAFGGLATYAGAQAQSHRKRARRSRNLELALASLGPYLESLPKGADKNEILAAFAYVFFGSMEDSDGGASSPIVGAQVRDLLKERQDAAD